MIDMLISKCTFAKVSLKLAAGDGVAATQVCLIEPWLSFPLFFFCLYYLES